MKKKIKTDRVCLITEFVSEKNIMSENKGFTIVKNEIINLGNISLKALGLFLYLKSKPKDWRFSTLRIRYDLQDGLSSISSAMQELERLKLLERRKCKNEKGQFEIEYIFLDQEETVIENPSPEIHERKPETGKSGTGKTKTRKPVVGKSKNIKKTEVIKKEEIIIVQEEVKPSENGSLFPKPPKPPKEEKVPDRIYTEMVKIYFDWFEKLSGGVKPKFGAIEGAAMKLIMNYFKSVHRDANDGSDEFEEVTKMFSIIFAKWNLIDPFLQDQTKVTQINSNLQNIIIQIKNGHKRKSTSNDKSSNSINARVQDSYNKLDEMLSNGKRS